jgi:transcriptional regulator with XRE-family HTH domain
VPNPPKLVPERDQLPSLLRQFRENAGLRAVDAARLLGVPRPKITQWETGAKHPMPWALDMLAYIYDLNAYQSWMLFFEAGYTTIDMPPPIVSMLRAWSNLPDHLQEPALHVFQGAANVVTQWSELSEAMGDRAQRRPTPTAEDVDRYWKSRAGSRYYGRRFDTPRRTHDRAGTPPRQD